MKHTIKKTIAEVTIDLEDGCIIKVTQENLQDLKMESFDTYSWTILICLTNGISLKVKVGNNDKLLESLALLTNNCGV